MWREYKEKEVECDRLQRIHTLENLAWLLEQGHCTPEELSEGPWRNAATLREKAGELRAQFLGKTESMVHTAALAVMTCKRATRDSCRGGVAVSSSSSGGRGRDTSRQDNTALQDSTASTALQDTANQDSTGDSSQPANQDATCQEREFTNPVSMDTTGDSSEHISTAAIWEKADETSAMNLVRTWIGLVQQLSGWRKEWDQTLWSRLMGTINSHILDSSQLMLGHEVSGRITDVSTVDFIAAFHLNKLEEARVESLRSLQSLLPPPSQWEVEQAYRCHLALSREGEGRRRRVTGLLACDVCKAESVLVQYGSELFSHYSYTNSMGQEHGEGARGAHAFEKIVRSFLTFLRHRRAPRKILDAGKTLVAYIEAVKKEYDSLGHRVSQYDELRLATSRMRYMTPSEMTDGGMADASAVHPMFWTVKIDVFENERVLAGNELTRSLGQVVYLKNLAKQTPVSDSDCGSCPICTRLLGKEIDEWGMLPCGHSLCMECVLELTRRAYYTVWQIRGGGSARLSCPLCRFSFLSSEINTVRPTEPEHMGNLSTKIRGVVQILQTIRSESATAKTLVFSYWVETLDLVSSSLTEYDIAHCFLKTPKTFQVCMQLL
ncbi:E3 ubiquitin-protein ligase SHPRH [Geodia barretti]|nr:E3 ubiquitin-protein ligase SHPRH [Geodia barretti]